MSVSFLPVMKRAAQRGKRQLYNVASNRCQDLDACIGVLTLELITAGGRSSPSYTLPSRPYLASVLAERPEKREI